MMIDLNVRWAEVTEELDDLLTRWMEFPLVELDQIYPS